MSDTLLSFTHPDFKDLIQNNKLIETYLNSFGKDSTNGFRTQGSSFILYFLISTFKGVVSVENAISFFKELKNQEKLDQNTLLETIFLIGYDIEKLDKADKPGQEYKTNFLELLKQLDTQGIVEKELLIERLEENYLAEANMIDKTTFQRKRARINTKNLYEQQKYNLFREENEGFAKLIIETLQNEYVNPQYLEAIKSNVLSLVGYFDLDPNRVLDIVLDAYECFPENIYYHDIIFTFKKEAIPHLLGLKFSNYQKITDCNTICAPTEIIKSLDEKGMTPISLYRITANLIKAGAFQIEDIWVHLSPSDEDLEKVFMDKYAIATALFKRNYEKRLNASEEQKKKDKEVELQNIAQVEGQLIYNQKLWLMEALVKNNSWTQFEQLFVSRNCIIDLTSHIPLLTTLCDFLEWLIEPVYRLISPTRYTRREPKIVQFPYDLNSPHLQLSRLDKLDFYGFDKILRVLKIIGPALGKNVILYTKICRLIKSYLEGPKSEDHERIYKIIVYISTQILLPTISLVRSNPGIVSTLWSIFQDFDFITRYQAYEDWLTHMIYSKPSLMLEGYNTIKQATPWFKTITVDTVKQKGRILGNISHNNPGLVFKLANQILKNYSNLIDPIVNALSYASNLSLDMIMFLTLRDLSNTSYEDRASEQFLREGTTSETHGNFSTFLGHFLRKYYSVDLTGLFSFLTKRLLNKQYLDLIIFKEIILKMSGCETLEALNSNQLQALAGGILLQIESAALTNDFKKAKKSSSALKNFFFKKTLNYIPTTEGETVSFAYAILVCLSVLRTEILYTDFEIGLKLISNLFDKISDSIIQFTQFLRYQTKESSSLYASLFPKDALLKLCLDNKIQPELAFHIIRPSLKPVYAMTPEERTELIELFKKSFDNFDPETMTKQKDPSYYTIIAPEFVWKDIKTQIWKNVTPELYTLFWALSLDNIYVPVERYEAEVQRLNEERSALEKESEAQKTTKAKKEKNVERIQNSKENFESEKLKLLQNKEKFDNFIEERREALFENITFRRINHVFVQVCLFPRLIFSPGDAVFAAKFVERWHKIRKLSYTDYLYSTYTILTIVLSCLQASTERETVHIGVFFTELFHLIAQWHDESSLKQVVKEFNPNEPFEFYKLQHIILTTFARMRGMLKSSLQTKDYVKAKNSILFLNKVLDIFPPVEEDAKAIREAIEKLQQNFANYEDIRKLGESYLAALKKKQDLLPSVDRNELKKKAYNKDKKAPADSTKSVSRDRKEEEPRSNRDRDRDRDRNRMEIESEKKKDDEYNKLKRSRDQIDEKDRGKDKQKGDRHESQRHGASSRKDTKDRDDSESIHGSKGEKKVKREEGEKERNRDEKSDRGDKNDRDKGDRNDKNDRSSNKEKDRDQERDRDRDDKDKDRDRSQNQKKGDHQEKSKVISSSRRTDR